MNGKTLRRVIAGSALAGLLMAAAYAEYRLPPVRISKKACRRKYPFALLLGCGLHEDGSMGRELRGRCNLALQLYAQGRFETLVVSGAAVKNKWVEAEGMERYLHEKCPQLPIVMETTACNTWENFQKTKELIGDQPLLVITGGLHARRAHAIARRFFSDVCVASFPDFTLKKAGREIISRLLYLKIELGKDLHALLHH